MNGFLLFAICNFDDIPIRFYEKKEMAIRAAERIKKPRSNPLGSMDITGLIGAKVLEFRNGKPVGKADFFEK